MNSDTGQNKCWGWNIVDRGWEDVADRIDPFLTAAIQSILKEYANDPVDWLIINRWPEDGRLIVVPGQGDPDCIKQERINCTLYSEYLEKEWRAIANPEVPEGDQEQAWDVLARKVWGRVGESLSHGDAARLLAEGRKSHRFLLACNDFDFEEGLIFLPELDPEAFAIIQTILARYRPSWPFPGNNP